ncbi:MAG: hypothetical protein JXQ71_01090 [Verrucomicrobia bacterium]|nr:hypothetical protein [Verrucomicrobiota bacterium]
MGTLFLKHRANELFNEICLLKGHIIPLSNIRTKVIAAAAAAPGRRHRRANATPVRKRPPSPTARSTGTTNSNSNAPAAFKQRVIVLEVVWALLWGMEAIDWALGGQLGQYGVRPREVEGL